MSVSQHVKLGNSLQKKEHEAKDLVKFKEALVIYMNYKNNYRSNNYEENSVKDIRYCTLIIILVSIKMTQPSRQATCSSQKINREMSEISVYET